MSRRLNSSKLKELRSYERWMPHEPPHGPMRHLNAKEISKTDLLIPRSVCTFYSFVSFSEYC